MGHSCAQGRAVRRSFHPEGVQDTTALKLRSPPTIPQGIDICAFTHEKFSFPHCDSPIAPGAECNGVGSELPLRIRGGGSPPASPIPTNDLEPVAGEAGLHDVSRFPLEQQTLVARMPSPRPDQGRCSSSIASAPPLPQEQASFVDGSTSPRPEHISSLGDHALPRPDESVSMGFENKKMREVDGLMVQRSGRINQTAAGQMECKPDGRVWVYYAMFKGESESELLPTLQTVMITSIEKGCPVVPSKKHPSQLPITDTSKIPRSLRGMKIYVDLLDKKENGRECRIHVAHSSSVNLELNPEPIQGRHEQAVVWRRLVNPRRGMRLFKEEGESGWGGVVPNTDRNSGSGGVVGPGSTLPRSIWTYSALIPENWGWLQLQPFIKKTMGKVLLCDGIIVCRHRKNRSKRRSPIKTHTDLGGSHLNNLSCLERYLDRRGNRVTIWVAHHPHSIMGFHNDANEPQWERDVHPTVDQDWFIMPELDHRNHELNPNVNDYPTMLTSGATMASSRSNETGWPLKNTGDEHNGSLHPLSQIVELWNCINFGNPTLRHPGFYHQILKERQLDSVIDSHRRSAPITVCLMSEDEGERKPRPDGVPRATTIEAAAQDPVSTDQVVSSMPAAAAPSPVAGLETKNTATAGVSTTPGPFPGPEVGTPRADLSNQPTSAKKRKREVEQLALDPPQPAHRISRAQALRLPVGSAEPVWTYWFLCKKGDHDLMMTALTVAMMDILDLRHILLPVRNCHPPRPPLSDPRDVPKSWRGFQWYVDQVLLPSGLVQCKMHVVHPTPIILALNQRSPPGIHWRRDVTDHSGGGQVRVDRNTTFAWPDGMMPIFPQVWPRWKYTCEVEGTLVDLFDVHQFVRETMRVCTDSGGIILCHEDADDECPPIHHQQPIPMDGEVLERYVRQHRWGISMLVAHPAEEIVPLQKEVPHHWSWVWKRVVQPTDDQDWCDIGTWFPKKAVPNSLENHVADYDGVFQDFKRCHHSSGGSVLPDAQVEVVAGAPATNHRQLDCEVDFPQWMMSLEVAGVSDEDIADQDQWESELRLDWGENRVLATARHAIPQSMALQSFLRANPRMRRWFNNEPVRLERRYIGYPHSPNRVMNPTAEMWEERLKSLKTARGSALEALRRGLVLDLPHMDLLMPYKADPGRCLQMHKSRLRWMERTEQMSKIVLAGPWPKQIPRRHRWKVIDQAMWDVFAQTGIPGRMDSIEGVHLLDTELGHEYQRAKWLKKTTCVVGRWLCRNGMQEFPNELLNAILEYVPTSRIQHLPQRAIDIVKSFLIDTHEWEISKLDCFHHCLDGVILDYIEKGFVWMIDKVQGRDPLVESGATSWLEWQRLYLVRMRNRWPEYYKAVGQVKDLFTQLMFEEETLHWGSHEMWLRQDEYETCMEVCERNDRNSGGEWNSRGEWIGPEVARWKIAQSERDQLERGLNIMRDLGHGRLVVDLERHREAYRHSKAKHGWLVSFGDRGSREIMEAELSMSQDCARMLEAHLKLLDEKDSEADCILREVASHRRHVQELHRESEGEESNFSEDYHTGEDSVSSLEEADSGVLEEDQEVREAQGRQDHPGPGNVTRVGWMLMPDWSLAHWEAQSQLVVFNPTLSRQPGRAGDESSAVAMNNQSSAEPPTGACWLLTSDGLVVIHGKNRWTVSHSHLVFLFVVAGTTKPRDLASVKPGPDSQPGEGPSFTRKLLEERLMRRSGPQECVPPNLPGSHWVPGRGWLLTTKGLTIMDGHSRWTITHPGLAFIFKIVAWNRGRKRNNSDKWQCFPLDEHPAKHSDEGHGSTPSYACRLKEDYLRRTLQEQQRMPPVIACPVSTRSKGRAFINQAGDDFLGSQVDEDGNAVEPSASKCGNAASKKQANISMRCFRRTDEWMESENREGTRLLVGPFDWLKKGGKMNDYELEARCDEDTPDPYDLFEQSLREGEKEDEDRHDEPGSEGDLSEEEGEEEDYNDIIAEYLMPGMDLPEANRGIEDHVNNDDCSDNEVDVDLEKEGNAGMVLGEGTQDEGGRDGVLDFLDPHDQFSRSLAPTNSAHEKKLEKKRSIRFNAGKLPHWEQDRDGSSEGVISSIWGLSEVGKGKPWKPPPYKRHLRVPKEKKGKKRKMNAITNGLDVNLCTLNHGSWARDPKVYNEACRQNLVVSLNFYALCMSWSKRYPRNIFRQASVSVKVVARELGYAKVVDWLGMKGWQFSTSGEGTLYVEYRQLRECLLRDGKRAQRTVLLDAMIKNTLDRCEKEKMTPALLMETLETIKRRLAHLHGLYHVAHFCVTDTVQDMLKGFGGKGFDLLDSVDTIYDRCRSAWHVYHLSHSIFVCIPDKRTLYNMREDMEKLDENQYYDYFSHKARSVNPSQYFQKVYNEAHALHERVSNHKGRKKKLTQDEVSVMVRMRVHHAWFRRYPHKKPSFWKLEKVAPKKIPQLPVPTQVEHFASLPVKEKDPRQDLIGMITDEKRKRKSAQMKKKEVTVNTEGVGNVGGVLEEVQGVLEEVHQQPMDHARTRAGTRIEETQRDQSEMVDGDWNDKEMQLVVKNLSPTDIIRRFTGCRMATKEDLRNTHGGGQFLCVNTNSDSVESWMFRYELSPLEMYSIPQLGRDWHYTRLHIECYGEPGTNVTMDKDYRDKRREYMVLRSQDETFKQQWEKHCYWIDVETLTEIAKLTITHGRNKCSVGGGQLGFAEKRDSGGWKLDMGCAGSSYMRKPDDRGINVPVKLTGMGPIQMPEYSTAKCAVSCLMDFLQGCIDEERKKVGQPLFFQNEWRDSMFAENLREALGCQICRMEWVTIQLKNLTMNHMVREHKDQRNCTAEGYDRTTSVCAVFVDSVDHVWSIKLIGNMNMHAGSYVKKRTRVEHVCSIIWPYTVDIDESYSELRARYRKGKWSLDCVPTWREPWKLFLDDNYDYEVLEVGGVGWEAGDTSVDPEVNRWECLKVRAGMDRSLWLSAGAHHIHQWRVKGKSLDELIELAWVGCYQNTWARFWKVVPKIERALEYEGTCRKMYGGFIGGPHKRFSPAGLKNGSLIALFLGKDKTFDESKWGGGGCASQETSRLG
jgi:hypothetical protein